MRRSAKLFLGLGFLASALVAGEPAKAIDPRNMDTSVKPCEDFYRYAEQLIEKGLASAGRLARLTAIISDRPGGLARFAGLIAAEGASIVDIAHDRVFANDDLSTVGVRCVVETRDFDHIAALRRRLQSEGFPLE